MQTRQTCVTPQWWCRRRIPPPPPKLRFPARKQKNKFERAAELKAEHARAIKVYQEQGWNIIYPDGSSELHPEAGRVGGYGVFFGDERDTAAYVPLGEEQTNIRAELKAALQALEGHRPGERSLICPIACSLLMVLGWEQKWR